MKYRKSEAKAYAKQHIKGVWVASVTPFTADYKIDEEGIRQNIRHCIDNLQIDGMFLNGLVGEGFNQSMAERKRVFTIVVEESKGDMTIMPYTSDLALENVVEMSRYAEEIGADYVTIINPKFYYGSMMTDEGVFQYYKYIADRVNIGIVLFNNIDSGYLMSPPLIDRIANIENVVGIKDIAAATHILRTRTLCGEKIVVSDAIEENWLMNLTVRGQEAYIATAIPFCLQSKKLKLIKEYTDLASKGELAKAWEAYRRLEPFRRALESVTPPGKVHATFKYWTQFLGMAGGDGRVRLPLQELTEPEKRAIKAAVETTGLI